MDNSKLQKAKASLMLEAPYFGNIASSIEIVKNDSIPTYRYRNGKLYLNSEWTQTLSNAEIVSILANTAMKKVLHHEERGEKKSSRVWDLATDYAINSMLLQNGFILPPEAPYDMQFEGMYAEEIYKLLSNDSDIDEEDSSDEQDSEDNNNNTENRLEKKLEKAYLKSLFDKMNRESLLPEGLERVIPSYFKNRIDWKERLRRYINEFMKSSYRFMPPNSKHLYRGYALPSLYSDTIEIVVAIDVSGSIDEESLGIFFSELESIMMTFGEYAIDVITCDYKIRGVSRYTTAEPIIRPTLEGGGSTDFRPLFDYVSKAIDNPKLIIYFSDAQGVFPDDTPNIDTLWILNSDANVPFGEKIVIEDS